MRIFYAADSTPNPDFDSNIWRNNLRGALVDLGHEVVDFVFDLRETFRHLDPALPGIAEFIAQNRPRLGAELLRQIRAAHELSPVRLFFSYFYDACIEPQVIDEIRALGIKTVNWFCNASYQLHLVREIAPRYDACLVPEKARLADYVALGARPVYCQEAANPRFYAPRDLPAEFDVTFVGQCYGDRPEHVLFLRENDIDVRVWGARWEHYVVQPSRNPLKHLFVKPRGLPPHAAGGVLADEEMVALFSRSKINLGFATCGETHRDSERVVQMRLRDFEVPMSGGFYLTEYQPELEEFFEIGREIECWRSRGELLEKIRHYLAHGDEREKIRRAGRGRCLRDHTWQRRLASAFAETGIA
jgi:spore maturation protein CgeB